MTAEPLRLARSALYVPGDAPDKLRSALDRGADELIVDLEDAVRPERKDLARDIVAMWLDDLPTSDVGVWVRVNPGEAGLEDIRAIGEAEGFTGVVLAKAESAADVEAASAVLDALGSAARIVPLLESGGAILRAAEIAAAPRVHRLQVGEADLRADLGVTLGPDERELLWVRSQIVVVSAASGIAPPIAPVSTDFRDLAALRASTEALARIGFVGRACIHPAQVAVVNEVFTPTAEAVAEAEEILTALAAAGSGVAVDSRGRMLDEAVARQARLVLARAHR
ncbi:HpcH/HpaI aldolase/citrate lyase family protein [Aeromicrobium wangtongii]|uniref:CoA ester lyase n=1 Tax=Aeromicrobium wangtongii TaxID=2969247 RepID=A0ABY5M777_9ACTN|nr:CoA ester lyase [Aeromicrobium wangtongii]MCD9198602.1 CoA ester lyase [Aeromicrobium wangtongii]UUP12627.1 CoA ester lyase [Aeromicrobium wangtongii]